MDAVDSIVVWRDKVMGEAWLAVAGTVFGGVGLKIVESFLGRNKTRDDSAHRFREELRAEILVLRQEADKIRDEADVLRDEIDNWRRKYFILVSEIAQGDLKRALDRINEKD